MLSQAVVQRDLLGIIHLNLEVLLYSVLDISQSRLKSVVWTLNPD